MERRSGLRGCAAEAKPADSACSSQTLTQLQTHTTHMHVLDIWCLTHAHATSVHYLTFYIQQHQSMYFERRNTLAPQ